MTDEKPEYLVSGPPINEEGILSSSEGDSEDFVQFDFETQAIFKRLADDIYKSDEAGIREPLTNAITAVIQAQNRYGLSNPQVEITVEDGDRPTVVMRDNGIGITQSILNEVLSVIGRSMNRNQGEVSGKYGMGFLACYKLVGTDGGFIMHTRSRETGESLSGLWTAGGFDPDPAQNFPNPFEQDGSYGTQFEFMVKEGISRSNLRKWVRNCAEWARLPVIYREFDSDGNEIFNEDYGTKELTDEYDDDTHILGINNDYFEAYCTPDSESRTILLDSPIGRNYRVHSDLPWDIDIRLKNENGVVIKGPHEGLEPVEDGEYESLSGEQREGLVRESDLTSNDLTLPSPIGTRDSLGSHGNFWDWLTRGLSKEYLKLAGDIAENLNDDPESFLSLDKGDRELLMSALDSSLTPRRPKRIAKKFRNEANASVDESTAEMLNDLKEKEKVVNRENYSYNSSTRYNETERKEIWEILPEDGSGEIWMGCKLSPDKVKVVHKDDDDNTVVQLNNTDQYEKYEELFGWRRLREIGSSTIDEFDISDDLAEKFKKNSKSSGTKGRLTIHYGGKDDDAFKKKADEVGDALSTGLTGYDIKTLVVFPRVDDMNVGDNKWIANTSIAVASCTSDQWEHLQDVDGVIRAKDFFQQARDMRLKTADGTVRAETLDFQNTVFHIVDKSAIDYFRQPEILRGCREYVQNKVTHGFRNRGPKYPDAEYVPVTRNEINKLRPLFSRTDNRDNQTTILVGDNDYDIGYRESIRFDAKVYAYARLPKWRDNPEVDVLGKLQCTMDGGALSLIETMGKLHDNGIDPASVEL